MFVLVLCALLSSCGQISVSAPANPQGQTVPVRVNAIIPCMGDQNAPRALLDGTPFKPVDYFGELASLAQPALGPSQRSVPWCLLVLETISLDGPTAIAAADELLTRKLYTRPYALSLEPSAYAVDPSTHSFDTTCAQRPALEREAATAQPIRLNQLRELEGVTNPALNGQGTVVAVLDGGGDPGTVVSIFSRRLIEADYPTANARIRELRDDFDCPETPGLDGHGGAVIKVLRAIAPQTNVLALKVCDGRGVCSTSSSAKALLYIRNRYQGFPSVDVVNMSFGGRPAHEDAVFRAILQNMMVEDTKVLFVTSMGNNPDTSAHYPADYQGMHFSLVPVAAAKRPISPSPAWALASFNMQTTLNGNVYGPLAAPAVGLSLEDGRVVTGTSFAAPVVSAVAALERQRDPSHNVLASYLHWNLQTGALNQGDFKLVQLGH
jgi:subtilisin family serine protease